MKLTTARLKKMIREELKKINESQDIINEALTDFQPFKGIRNVFQGEEGDKKVLKKHLDEFTQMYDRILSKYFERIGQALAKSIDYNEHEKLNDADIWEKFVRKFANEGIRADLEKLNNYIFKTTARSPKGTPVQGLSIAAIDDDRDYDTAGLGHNPKEQATSIVNGIQMRKMFREILGYTAMEVYNTGGEIYSYIESILPDEHFEAIIDQNINYVMDTIKNAYQMSDRYEMIKRKEREREEKEQSKRNQAYNDAQRYKEKKELEKKRRENWKAYREYIDAITPDRSGLEKDIIGYGTKNEPIDDSGFEPPHPEVWTGGSKPR
jgi:predicted ribosome quality control (RQC) complex YloA/Tae2 family protein